MSDTENSNQSSENPYDFIVNEVPKPKKPSLFSSQSSFKQRLLVILGGGLALIIIIVIISSIFSSPPKTTAIVSIGEQQTTLITLATEADQTANLQVTKNLATNIELSLSSGQVNLVKYLKRTGSKITSAGLLTKKTTQLKAELTATPANNIDTQYVQMAKSELTSYISAIKQAYTVSDPASQKVLLNNLYASSELLLKEANTTATSLTQIQG